MLVEEIKKLAFDSHLWNKNTRILIAVSTGLDSMVLLDVMEKLQSSGLAIGVAHLNHQLRDLSTEEETFLRAYCLERQIPFYCERWENPVTANVEAQAREVRYAFFKKIMEAENYQVLVTAHHSDDQAETMLMKMLRTGELFASRGILLKQPFGIGSLVRPLLYHSKEDLIDYGLKHGIVYYEDETNKTLDYQRNRFRHQVLPVFKQENPQALAHFQQISEQIQLLEAWIVQEQARWTVEAIQTTAEQLTIDLNWYAQRSEIEQSFFLVAIAQQGQAQFGLSISKKQRDQVAKLLEKGKSQWVLDLGADWQFIRRYQQLVLQKKESSKSFDLVHPLKLGEGIFLSDKAWVGLFLPGEEKVLEKVKDWAEFRQEVVLESSNGLSVGKRQMGERIPLSTDLTKKISRYFIDQKIPMNQREDSWVLRDKHKKVLALLPHVLSYLSIGEETDKIHYVLLFKYQK